MTLEQALLAALTVVSGVLVTIWKLLWDEAKECKSERKVIREELDECREQLGLHTGRLEAVDHCPTPACPFRRVAKAAALGISVAAVCLMVSCAAAPSGISVGWEGEIGGVPIRASYRPGGKASVLIDGGRWLDRRVNPTK